MGFCIHCDYSTPESHHFADQHSDIYPEVKKKCISISLQIKRYFFGFENLNLYTSTLGLIKITKRGMKKIYI